MVKNCLYCGSTKNVQALKQWDKEQNDYYCDDHINMVRRFQEEQMRGFLNHFKDKRLRHLYLGKQQQELYEKLAQKTNGEF